MQTEQSAKSLYFIAIVPEEPLLGRINTIKAEVAQKYKTKASLKSPAHITLFPPFMWPKENEKELETDKEKELEKDKVPAKKMNTKSLLNKSLRPKVNTIRPLIELPPKGDKGKYLLIELFVAARAVF